MASESTSGRRGDQSVEGRSNRERLAAIVREGGGDRVVRSGVVVVIVSLWLTLAFRDASFLVLLLATGPVVWWWRRSASRDDPGELL